MEHICTVCFLPVEQHDSECDLGCHHFPPLCCQGCGCGSFEEAHPQYNKTLNATPAAAPSVEDNPHTK